MLRVLRALNHRGEQIVPSLLSYDEIEKIRKQTFYCPQCNEQVVFRAGPKVIPHFAHHPHSACKVSTYGESSYHKRAKILLYHWLRNQQIKVHLEQFLPSINQRPDLLIEINNRKIALEFQSSTISSRELNDRNNGYKKININPLWVLGKNRLVKKAPYTYRISSPLELLSSSFINKNPTKLIYFCPEERAFTIISDFYFTNTNQAIAKPNVISLRHNHFHHLFKKDFFPKRKLYKLWYRKKKIFRLSSYKVYGKELQYRKWLYYKRLHVEQLPSVIHLPIRSQYKMNVPLWHWQSKLVINVLHPLQIGHTISISRCLKEIIPYVNKRYCNDAYEVIEQYFAYLKKVKIFKKMNKQNWIKLRSFRFHRYIEQSLKADKLLLQYLRSQI